MVSNLGNESQLSSNSSWIDSYIIICYPISFSTMNDFFHGLKIIYRKMEKHDAR